MPMTFQSPAVHGAFAAIKLRFIVASTMSNAASTTIKAATDIIFLGAAVLGAAVLGAALSALLGCASQTLLQTEHLTLRPPALIAGLSTLKIVSQCGHVSNMGRLFVLENTITTSPSSSSRDDMTFFRSSCMVAP